MAEGGHKYFEFLLVFLGVVTYIGVIGGPTILGGGDVNPDNPTQLSSCGGNGSIINQIGCVQEIAGLFSGLLDLSSPIGVIGFVLVPAITIAVAYLFGRFILEIIPG